MKSWTTRRQVNRPTTTNYSPGQNPRTNQNALKQLLTKNYKNTQKTLQNRQNRQNPCFPHKNKVHSLKYRNFNSPTQRPTFPQKRNLISSPKQFGSCEAVFRGSRHISFGNKGRILNKGKRVNIGSPLTYKGNLGSFGNNNG